MTIRVLHIVHGLGVGGAETWLLALLDHFSRSGEVEIDILITGGKRQRLDGEAQSLGACLHYIPYNRNQLLTFSKDFRKLLREQKYDAIHDHQDIQSGFHFLLGGRNAPPIRITHLHNPIYQVTSNYARSTLRRFIVTVGKQLIRSQATHILGTSAQLIEEYGFNKKDYNHLSRGPLHCGVQTASFQHDRNSARTEIRHEFGWASTDRLVLFAGRLDEHLDPAARTNHKNSGFALNVLIQAMREHTDMVALFAGAFSIALAALEERVAAAGLTGRIVFAGIRRDVPRLMSASDALFFPSRGEGLGMVAVEAQAAGLPVLASTAVPRECVVVHQLVHFVDLSDPISIWIDRLNALTQLRSDSVAANKAVATSRFSIERSAAALVDLYGTGNLVTHW
jgi:glycosyltransferase involved in cell wall biosynthesis